MRDNNIKISHLSVKHRCNVALHLAEWLVHDGKAAAVHNRFGASPRHALFAKFYRACQAIWGARFGRYDAGMVNSFR